MKRAPTSTDEVEIDMRALLRALFRALPILVIFAGLVGAGAFYGLSKITPTYRADTTVLIEPQESDLTKSSSTGGASTATLDEETIASQVQLVLSREIGRRIVAKLDLASRPDYQKAVKGGSLVNDLLAKVGLSAPSDDSSVEERVLAEYYRNLQVVALDKSHVISIAFSSTDPKFAAEAANAIAAEYIALERSVRRDTTTDATKFLEAEIADLRTKVKDAEAKVEEFRAENNLFTSGGGSAATLPQQQLADLNAELTRVQAAKVDAEAKAQQIRASLKTGAVPNITDVLNSQLIQRLVEQQVALRASIAELSATLLPEHPRMKELTAQLLNLNQQIDREAQKILAAVEAEAELSLARESEIEARLEAMKSTAANANTAEVQLRALEREAAAQRDLLDTYLRRYREALARQNDDFLPADARVISEAAVPIRPDFPKIVPMTAAATVAALLLAIAFVLIRELASGRPMRRVEAAAAPSAPLPAAPEPQSRWADDQAVRRMMPSEPSLAPPMPSEAERALDAIAGQIVAGGKRRILVTLAEGSSAGGRPLGAVALARALARAERRAVLVDLHRDGADGAALGQGTGLPGFSDLYTGDASFAQVIFRDRRSRAHFIPAGRRPLSADGLAADRLGMVLGALDQTYDHVVVDAGDEFVERLAPDCGAAVVVSEHGASDPRTIRAFDRIAAVSAAMVLLLVVEAEPAGDKETLDQAEAAA